MSTGESFDPVGDPGKVESVITRLPTGDDGELELWKCNRYYDRLDDTDDATPWESTTSPSIPGSA
jgi:hypothetical protein